VHRKHPGNNPISLNCGANFALFMKEKGRAMIDTIHHDRH
jgi:hypothetical protein